MIKASAGKLFDENPNISPCSNFSLLCKLRATFFATSLYCGTYHEPVSNDKKHVIIMKKLGDRQMGKKEIGYCHICGCYGELSYEHIPPENALNTNKAIFSSKSLSNPRRFTSSIGNKLQNIVITCLIKASAGKLFDECRCRCSLRVCLRIANRKVINLILTKANICSKMKQNGRSLLLLYRIFYSG